MGSARVRPTRLCCLCVLDDLVESGAWLDLELKRPFLALWVNDEDFDNPEAYSVIGKIGFRG